ncbi:Gfo/Idh/MocA family protein [Pseudomonas gingeri]|uniref:Gfo/Idh/MocA family protein n=2 Tax=Pseudomonas gingeri TaxID=117681 RepID=UPI001C434965|nr:Gfo/Idh/MocA family oxidoreductase [Pseudomonas gingeri]
MNRPIRIGMVGGGAGAFIGNVHRIALRLDGQYRLLAAALSSNPQRAADSARELFIDPERSYSDYREMARIEALREDGIEAVAIVTPNHLHAPVATAFLEAGIHVICDKPLCLSLAQAHELQQVAERSNRLFMLTHNYSAYPLIRHARELVNSGELGELRTVHVEYAQGWLTEALPDEGWRGDPAMAGAGGALGDIATHAFQLVRFVSGLRVESLAAELTSFVANRKLDDYVQAMLRFQGGARGVLWASQVAAGMENALQIRITGSRASISFNQENPNQLWFTRHGQPAQLLTRGGPGMGDTGSWGVRVPAGHSEGYLEAFALLYRDFASQIRSFPDLESLPPEALLTPTLADGIEGMAFMDAVLRSHELDSRWVSFSRPQI